MFLVALPPVLGATPSCYGTRLNLPKLHPMQVALGEGSLLLRRLLLDCDYINSQLVGRQSWSKFTKSTKFVGLAKPSRHAWCDGELSNLQHAVPRCHSPQACCCFAQGPDAGWEVTAAYVGSARASVPITALYSQVLAELQLAQHTLFLHCSNHSTASSYRCIEGPLPVLSRCVQNLTSGTSCSRAPWSWTKCC